MRLLDIFKKKNKNDDKLVISEISMKHIMYRHSQNQYIEEDNDKQQERKTCYIEINYLINLEEKLKSKNFNMNSINSILIGQDNKLYIF